MKVIQFGFYYLLRFIMLFIISIIFAVTSNFNLLIQFAIFTCFIFYYTNKNIRIEYSLFDLDIDFLDKNNYIHLISLLITVIINYFYVKIFMLQMYELIFYFFTFELVLKTYFDICVEELVTRQHLRFKGEK